MLGKIDQVHRPYAPIRSFRPEFTEKILRSKEALKTAIYVFWHAIRNYRSIRVDHDIALDAILYTSARGDLKYQEREDFKTRCF